MVKWKVKRELGKKYGTVQGVVYNEVPQKTSRDVYTIYLTRYGKGGFTKPGNFDVTLTSTDRKSYESSVILEKGARSIQKAREIVLSFKDEVNKRRLK